MQLRPIGDHLIVKPLAKEEKPVSGIIIPDTVEKERAERGEVVAVGPGRTLENGTRSVVDVKVGDKVVFKKYAPDEIKLDGVEFLVIKMEDVVAVIE